MINIINKKLIISCVSIIGMCVSASAQAEIFKCTNLKGSVYYNDKPCPEKDEEKKINAEKDPVNGYVPPNYVGSILNNKDTVIGSNSSRDINSNLEKEAQEEALADKQETEKEKRKAKNAKASYSKASRKNSGHAPSGEIASKIESFSKHPTKKMDYSSSLNLDKISDNPVRRKVEQRVLSTQERRNLLNIRIHHE